MAENSRFCGANEREILRKEYRFIRDDDHKEERKEGDEREREAPKEGSDECGKKMARQYDDGLFREYAIADMSRFETGEIGLRWRTQKEVLAGKGQFTCGARGCERTGKDLRSFEVEFKYDEADAKGKVALVKLRLCPDCAVRLHWKSDQRRKKRALNQRRHQQKQHDDSGSDSDGNGDDEQRRQEEKRSEQKRKKKE